MKSLVGEVTQCIPGQNIRCWGVVPKNLDVFLDHFPDFPVLPGVLALEILRYSVALCCKDGKAEESIPQQLQSVQAVKFQHFLRPGEAWESDAVYSPGKPLGSWSVKLIVQGKIAVSARMVFSSGLSLVTKV